MTDRKSAGHVRVIGTREACSRVRNGRATRTLFGRKNVELWTFFSFVNGQAIV